MAVAPNTFGAGDDRFRHFYTGGRCNQRQKVLVTHHFSVAWPQIVHIPLELRIKYNIRHISDIKFSCIRQIYSVPIIWDFFAVIFQIKVIYFLLLSIGKFNRIYDFSAISGPVGENILSAIMPDFRSIENVAQKSPSCIVNFVNVIIEPTHYYALSFVLYGKNMRLTCFCCEAQF